MESLDPAPGLPQPAPAPPSPLAHPQRIPDSQKGPKGYITSLKILESVPWASWAPLSPL